MPPNSMVEWMIGQNVPRKIKRAAVPETRKPLYRLEVSTDDGEESDTVTFTYPRNGRHARNQLAAVPAEAVKKVRFIEAPKSALKRTGPSALPAAGGESSEGDVSSAETDAGATTSESEDDGAKSSEQDASDDSEPAPKKSKKGKNGAKADEQCPCDECVAERKKKKEAKHAKGATPEPSGDDSDAEPEKPTKKDKKKQEKKKSGGEAKKPDPESTEASEATQTEDEDKGETEAKEPHQSTNKKQDKKKKGGEKPAEEPKAKDDGGGKGQEEKKAGKQQKAKGNGKENLPAEDASKDETAKPGDGAALQASKKAGKSGNSAAETALALLPTPELRQPNLLMPIKAQVLQDKHTKKTPKNPRPNAFLDYEHGIIRVYHGPAYGAAWGALYPKRVWSGPPPPIGVPHPLSNPYFGGYDPAAGAGAKPPPNKRGGPRGMGA